MSAKKGLTTNQKIIKLVTPSELGSIFIVVLSFAISLIVIFLNRYRQDRLTLNNMGNSLSTTLKNGSLAGTITQDRFINDLPTICFVIAIAIFIYFVARDINRLSSKKLKAKKFFKYSLIRLISLVIIFPYLALFFNNLLVYSVKIAIYSTTASNILSVTGYVILSVITSTISIHISIVLLRILSLKKRLLDL